MGLNIRKGGKPVERNTRKKRNRKRKAKAESGDVKKQSPVKLPDMPGVVWWHMKNVGNKPALAIDVGVKMVRVVALAPDLTVRLYTVDARDFDWSPMENPKTAKKVAAQFRALGRKHDITKGAREALKGL